ncbi:MAG: type VI secretion system tip protein VgrG, partial [Deltaproteobacteria bacterium]|nr:type VI secretion system tip protein VgrG [Deltaproteobacteria bacterium]
PAATSPEPAPAPASADADDQSSWQFVSNDRTHVHYTLRCDAAGDAWQVRRVVIDERLDRPYEAILDVTNDDTTADPMAFLGQPAVLTIERHTPREVQGVVRRVERGASGGSARSITARLVIVPALWTLSQSRNTRVFQDKSVPEILEEVLSAGLGAFQRSIDLQLQATYQVREYCMQWEESDLDFCHRLMEEEGIWYFFDHSGDTETMVLGDGASAFPGLETSDGQAVQYSILSQGSGPVEAVTDLISARQLVPNKVVVREYDWTRPATAFTGEGDLSGDAAASSDEPQMEEYVHGPSVHFSRFQSDTFGGDDATKQAELVKQRNRTRIEVSHARSELTNVSPGKTFELVGHPVAELDRRWLVVAVHHEGSGRGDGGGGGSSEGEVEYTNRLELVPADVEWRPARTRWKRRVHSVLTATVVGPSGEEIHTDVHGRIKVQFHWDREGQNDDRSSCFLRSMQPWAGQSWGMVFLPRIGMEVVVTFVDGDVDRPLVIGSVYNARNPPPYTLPDDKTKSTIKSNSSPGGDGFNEIRFEDAAGNEEVFIHAQKDMNEKVLHNHSRSVGANETISVTGNRTKSVDKNENVTIKGSHKTTIQGAESGDGQSITGGHVTVTGDYQLDTSKTILAKAPDKVRLECQDTYIEMTPSQIKLHCGGATLILEAAQIEAKSSQETVVRLNADAKVLSSGAAELFMNADVDLKNSAGSHVNFEGGTAKLESSQGGIVELTNNAAMEGLQATMTGQTKAKVSGAAEAALEGGGGAVKATPAGVDASGPQVNLTGQGMVNIAGAVVKIN